MGLNLAVFKSARRLSRELGTRCAVIDFETGEASAAGVEHSLKEVTAADERIGNASSLAHLERQVASYLGLTDGVVARLLSSGSGETFVGTELEELVREIQRLTGCPDVDVQTFCSAVQRLLAVAAAEENPIVVI